MEKNGINRERKRDGEYNGEKKNERQRVKWKDFYVSKDVPVYKG